MNLPFSTNNYDSCMKGEVAREPFKSVNYPKFKVVD